MYCIQTKAVKTIQLCLRTAVPSLSGTRDRFCGRRPFFHGPRVGGWFRDDSMERHVLCTLFPLLLYQLHLRGSGIRSQRLGTPAVQEVGSLQSSCPWGWGRGWETRSKHVEKSTGCRWRWTPLSICALPSLRLQNVSEAKEQGSEWKWSHLQKNSHRSRFWILWILLILLRSIVFPKRLATSLYSCVWLCNGISWKEKMALCYRGSSPPLRWAGGHWVLPSPGRAARCSRSPSVAAWGWPRSHRCNLEQKRQNNILEADYNHGQRLRHFLPSWIIMWQKQYSVVLGFFILKHLLNIGLCATFLGAALRNLMGNFKNDIISILFSCICQSFF